MLCLIFLRLYISALLSSRPSHSRSTSSLACLQTFSLSTLHLYVHVYMYIDKHITSNTPLSSLTVTPVCLPHLISLHSAHQVEAMWHRCTAFPVASKAALRENKASTPHLYSLASPHLYSATSVHTYRSVMQSSIHLITSPPPPPHISNGMDTHCHRFSIDPHRHLQY